MAHTSNGRGGLIVRVKFRGVPLIRRSVGSADPAVAERVELMYHALYEQGRLDVLEAIARKRLHPMAALAQWRQGREIELPPADVLPKLSEAWEAWERAVPGDEHRASIGTTRRTLRIPEGATIADLPDLFMALHRRERSKVRTVNLARAHVRAFLRDTVGTSHALYTRVADVRPLARKQRERGTPHPLPFILDVCSKLNALHPGAGDMAWAMAVTGMGNKEYWHDGFQAVRDRVLIHGQKRGGRDREVPLWAPEPLVQPVVWEGKLRDLLTEASAGAVQIYDLRRSFARWCEEAGVIDTNIDAYLGHGPKTMTGLYTWGQLPGQLARDAELLRAYRERELREAVAEAAEG
jgi:hypothetical protein